MATSLPSLNRPTIPRPPLNSTTPRTGADGKRVAPPGGYHQLGASRLRSGPNTPPSMFYLDKSESGDVSTFATHSALPQLPIRLKPPGTAERLLTPRDRKGTYKQVHGWDETPRSPPRTADGLMSMPVGLSTTRGQSGTGSRSRCSHLNFNPMTSAEYSRARSPKDMRTKKFKLQLKDAEARKKDQSKRVEEERQARAKLNRTTLFQGKAVQGIPITPANLFLCLWRQLRERLEAPPGAKGSYKRFANEQLLLEEEGGLQNIRNTGKRLERRARVCKTFLALLNWDVVSLVVHYAFPAEAHYTFVLAPMLLRDRRSSSYLEQTTGKRAGVTAQEKLLSGHRKGEPTPYDVEATCVKIHVVEFSGLRADPEHKGGDLGAERELCSHISITTPASSAVAGGACQIFRLDSSFVKLGSSSSRGEQKVSASPKTSKASSATPRYGVKLTWVWDGQRRQHLSAGGDRFQNHLIFYPAPSTSSTVPGPSPPSSGADGAGAPEHLSPARYTGWYDKVDGMLNDQQGVYSMQGVEPRPKC